MIGPYGEPNETQVRFDAICPRCRELTSGNCGWHGDYGTTSTYEPPPIRTLAVYPGVQRFIESLVAQRDAAEAEVARLTTVMGDAECCPCHGCAMLRRAAVAIAVEMKEPT